MRVNRYQDAEVTTPLRNHSNSHASDGRTRARRSAGIKGKLVLPVKKFPMSGPFYQFRFVSKSLARLRGAERDVCLDAENPRSRPFTGGCAPTLPVS
jgi:hypothetical protein